MKALRHYTFWVSFFFFHSLQFFSFQSLPSLLQSGFLEFLHWGKLRSIDLESNMSLWFFGSRFSRNNKGRMFSFHNHGLLSQSATPDLFLLSIITPLCSPGAEYCAAKNSNHRHLLVSYSKLGAV